MEFKTLVGPVEEIDKEMNSLAQEGWTVHTHSVMSIIERDDGMMPIFSVLMQRYPTVQEEQEKQERKFIGRR